MTFASLVFGTSAQAQDASMISAIQCQEINSAEVALPEFAIDNFDRNTQAFLFCRASDGEMGPDVLMAGSIPLTKGIKNLSLEDIKGWSQNPASSDIFLRSGQGDHLMKEFLTDVLPVDRTALDVLFGPAIATTKIEHVCTTTDVIEHVCTIQAHEECIMIYGRPSCKVVEEEVCSDVSTPTETCSDQEVVEYYRHIAEIDGYSKAKGDPFCPYGVIEKQTTTIYGRVVNEKRCCESKIINGAATNICTEWVIFK